MRKALVSDIVRSFVYVCRKQRSHWPHPILGFQLAPLNGGSCDVTVFSAFIAFALNSHKGNYITAMRPVILLATWLKAFNNEEQRYALYLLEKYHGNQ